MKLILSRKGFDSSTGKVPSPIFANSRMLSLPIPDKGSPIAYEDISWQGEKGVGAIVECLTRSRIKRHYRAHLDPDLLRDSLPRETGWRPIFGQVGAAEGHLENCGITSGDLFLFFGLFRKADGTRSNLRYRREASPEHVLFGWLQIGRRVFADICPREKMAWALYHPYLNRDTDPRNALYVAYDRLTIPGHPDVRCPGAGVFERYSDRLRLTARFSQRPSEWLLPNWFCPEGRKSCLTYHVDTSRWRTFEGGVLLKSVQRGQEFVLDCRDYPEAYEWLGSLFAATRTAV